MLFHYGNCKNEIFDLNNEKYKLRKEIQELNAHILTLVGEAQEAKAIYHYQVSDLEKKIQLLESKIQEPIEKEVKPDPITQKLLEDNEKLNSEVTTLSVINRNLEAEKEDLLVQLKALRKDYNDRQSGAVALKAGAPKRKGHVTLMESAATGKTLKMVDYTKPDGETVIKVD